MVELNVLFRCFERVVDIPSMCFISNQDSYCVVIKRNAMSKILATQEFNVHIPLIVLYSIYEDSCNGTSESIMGTKG